MKLLSKFLSDGLMSYVDAFGNIEWYDTVNGNFVSITPEELTTMILEFIYPEGGANKILDQYAVIDEQDSVSYYVNPPHDILDTSINTSNRNG